MTAGALDILLYLFLGVAAVTALRVRDLLASVVILSAFSFVTASFSPPWALRMSLSPRRWWGLGSRAS